MSSAADSSGVTLFRDGGEDEPFNKFVAKQHEEEDDNQIYQYLIDEPFTSVAEDIHKIDGGQENAYNKVEAEEVEEVDMEIEEQEGDDQADRGLIGESNGKANEIDGSSSMDCSSVNSAQNNHHEHLNTSTAVVFEANAASKFVLPWEDNLIGNVSVNAPFCKASDEIGITNYKKQDVPGGDMIATVSNRAYLESMPDRKRLIEPVTYKLDATQIAENSSHSKLTDCNKRPAIICSFFAKGWCIKGKSCRFLHIKDEIATEGKSVAVAAHHKCEGPLGKDSSLAEDLALIDGEILKQKNEVSDLLKRGPGFHAFLGHETWPISSVGQQFLPFSTSWGRDTSQIQKCLDSYPVYKASETSHLQHYSSPSSGSGLRDHPRPKLYAEVKNTRFGNWEPSIPFRPSHIITQRILSNGKRRDATHESAENTHTRDKVSQQGQEASGESNNICSKAHEKSVKTLCPGNDFQNNFISGSSFHSKEIPKTSSKIQSVNEEITAERQRSSLLNGKDSSVNSIESRNIVGADLVDENDSEPCTDRQSHTTQPKIDCVRQDNGAHVGRNTDANLLKESKELKIFHAALVERVKELLRQPWHDGILSKDVYKLIVKKTVDKVISTMEPHHIPDTTDSIKQYFSLFSGKHMKLVEAYVDKYGGKPLPG